MRGASSPGRPAMSRTILSAVWRSSTGSSLPSVTETSRLLSPQPNCDWKFTRASGILANAGASERSNSVEVCSRLSPMSPPKIAAMRSFSDGFSLNSTVTRPLPTKVRV